MTYENIEQVNKWFEEFNSVDDAYNCYNFDDIENKPHESLQISILLFLYSKLKDNKKPKHRIMHGEHDTVFVGYFDWFNDFTKEDVLTLMRLGVFVAEENDGFQFWASL